ncbi:MAG: hypothetical protein R2712_03365 [Vicinamibacterales bacterium]
MPVRAAIVLLVWAVLAPRPAAAQQADMSTSAAASGSGPVTSVITFDTILPEPAGHGVALPSVTVADDGSGLRVRSLVLDLSDVGFGGVSAASRLGDQQLPSVFRSGSLSGSGLGASIRGMSLTTSGATRTNLSFGQMGDGFDPAAPTVAAAALTYVPSPQFSLTPQVVVPVSSSDAQTSIGTAIRATVPGNVSLTTSVGVAGTAASPWSPLLSARVTGKWPYVGVETSVVRGAAAPSDDTERAFVTAQDREAAQVQLRPWQGFTLAALASASRPSATAGSADTILGSFRVAYDDVRTGLIAAVRQRETAASRASEVTSLEWRPRGPRRIAVRFVQRQALDSAAEGLGEDSSRVEVDLPSLTPRSAGVDVRAAISASASSLTGPGMRSRFSGRVGLARDTALMGETELGLTADAGRLLRLLRVTTEMPVVTSTRLQLSYSYRAGPRFTPGQLFEARILRRLALRW